MKKRPILFSAPMVRALLDGSKTQTRRVVKPRPDWAMGNRCMLQPHELAGEVNQGEYSNCPYGQPGDRLWVRETFADLQGTGIEHRPISSGPLQRYAFAVDTKPGSHGDEARKEFGVKWKPSIFMPRAASRITLEITGVRVERLQDISEADAAAEGVSAKHTADAHYTAREAYAVLWGQINGGGSWDLNPWVWVIEFKKADQ